MMKWLLAGMMPAVLGVPIAAAQEAGTAPGLDQRINDAVGPVADQGQRMRSARSVRSVS